MKILRAQIYGFGNWVDETIDFAEASFICIYGENETGKSTLQQFLLFMLFGLSPKLRAFYQPKTSGRMGGRLTVLDHHGETFTIERLDQIRNGSAVCYTEAGGEHGEAWLEQRLQGMTRATYQSTFSFSGLDLAGIKTMKEDDLGDVLLGIGLTGAANLHTLEKKLDKQIGDLFKRYGRKPVINQQLATLDEIFSELKKQEYQEAGYRDKKASVQALSDEIASLQSAAQQKRDKQLALEKQLQALPVLKDYLHYEEQLAAYPSALSFPENGLERLQQLKEKLLPLKSEQAVVIDNQKKYQKKLEALQQTFYAEEIYEQAEDVLKKKQDYLDDKREIAKLQEMINKQHVQIETELKQLGVGMAAEDLQTITFPFHIEKTWNDIKNQQEQLNKEQEQLQQEEERIKQEHIPLQKQKQDKESELLSAKQKKELTDRLDTYERAHYRQSLQHKNVKQQAKWERMKDVKQQRLKHFFTGSVIAAVVLAIIAGIVRIPLLFGGAGFLLFAGILQYFSGKQAMQTTEQMLQDEADQESSVPIVTAEEKERAEHLLAKDQALQRSLETIQERIKSNHMQQLQLEERKAAYIAKEKRHTDQVNMQVADYPFLEQVQAGYWPELFLTLKRLLQLARQKNEYVTSSEEVQQSVIIYEKKLRMFFNEINREMSDQSVPIQIDAIEQISADYRESGSLMRQYEKWLQENREQLRSLKQKMHVYEQEISALYNTAAVDDEEAFLQREKMLAEKKETETKRDQLSYQLRLMLSEEAYRSLTEKGLIDEQLLQEKYEQKTVELQRLDEEFAEKQQQLADVRADVAKMEASGTYSEHLHRFTIEQEHLKQLAEEWSVLKTAKEMLAETKRDYREKYLSKVIQRTAAYFSALTDGRYIRVFVPGEGRLFQVEAHNGLRYGVQELSQGTIDQLYVSLRLAISEIMSEEHRLPFIIDDAFVYFDAHRTKVVVDLLAQHAVKQQMIIFTCKREIAEAAKTAEVITLAHNTQYRRQSTV